MENTTKVSLAYKKLPFDIIAFYLFAIAISVFSFYLRLDVNKELKASLMPYTGWGFGRGYLFMILAITGSLFTYRVSVDRTLRNLRIFIIIFMLIDVYSGVEDWRSITPEDYTNPNPYLRYDTLTPVYTIGVPLFWALLMAGTLLWHYFKNRKEKSLSTDTSS
jgi:hypothetical protein